MRYWHSILTHHGSIICLSRIHWSQTDNWQLLLNLTEDGTGLCDYVLEVLWRFSGLHLLPLVKIMRCSRIRQTHLGLVQLFQASPAKIVAQILLLNIRWLLCWPHTRRKCYGLFFTFLLNHVEISCIWFCDGDTTAFTFDFSF